MSIKVKFGGTVEEQDYLAQLVLQGEKIATSSLYEITLKHTNVGEVWEIIDSKNRKIAMVEVTKVQQRKFKEIDEAFAQEEGDQTYRNWYEIHWNYYGEILKNRGAQITEETVLECVWFQKIKNLLN